MAIKTVIIALFLFLSLFCFFASALGTFRMSDFYSKLHAAGICGSSGLIFCFLGFLLYEGLNLTSVKMFLVFLFVFLTSPMGTHIITKVAFKENQHKNNVKEAS